MVLEEGVGCPPGIENTQLIGFASRRICSMWPFDGFVVQKRVQGRKAERTEGCGNDLSLTREIEAREDVVVHRYR